MGVPAWVAGTHYVKDATTRYRQTLYRASAWNTGTSPPPQDTQHWIQLPSIAAVSLNDNFQLTADGRWSIGVLSSSTHTTMLENVVLFVSCWARYRSLWSCEMQTMAVTIITTSANHGVIRRSGREGEDSPVYCNCGKYCFMH